MALEKQVLSYSLTEGLDTKTDPKAVPPPKLLLLENARRAKAGTISKRFGHEALGKSVTGLSETTENADALGVFNDELLIFANQSAYSYSESSETSAYKGGCISAAMTLADVVRNSYEQTQVDSAVNGNVSVVAYEDSRGGVYCSVYDNVSGTILLRDQLLDASGTRPRCAAFGSYLYAFYVVSGDIKARRINPLDPASVPSAITVSSAINTTNPNFDILIHDAYILLGHNVQGASQTRLIRLDTELAVVSTVNIAEASTSCLTLVRGDNSRTFVLYHDGSDVRCAIHDVHLVVVAAPFLVETVADIVQITGYAKQDGTGVRVFYHKTAAATYNHLIRQNTITNAGSAGSASVFLRSVGLASKAWAYSADTTDRGFVGVVHSSAQQTTLFIARNDGMIVGKAQAGIHGGFMARDSFLPGAWACGTGKYQLATLSKRLIGADAGLFVTLKGVSLVSIDFGDVRNFTAAQLAGNSLIVGGIVQGYDGQGAVEHGFHLYPENLSAAGAAGGSLTLLGTYSHVYCYEWVDNKGQVHRSAPSTAVQTVLTGGNQRITLTIPTLRLTRKTGVQIVVYRTENNGSVYYQATSPSAPTYNDTTADTISYNDDLADSTLIGRAPLYTTAGQLENIAPPSATLIAIYRNRVVLGGTEDDTLWFSKQVRPNRPVEFNDAFIIKADPVGGKITAHATLDDKLILFKQESIFYTYGDGPDDTGVGQPFVPPEKATSDAGCVDARSVVEMPLGLMFKSRKGFYILTRDLQTQYIGAPVEDFNGYSVTCATLVSDENEVRFGTEGGPTIVYNYFFDQWMVWPSFMCDDSTNWRGKFVAILRRSEQASRVVRQANDTFFDINTSYPLRVSLGWASFAQLQGFQRIWRALFLGDYKSPHQLKVSVGYGFTPYWSDEYYWDPVDRLSIDEMADGVVYGADEVYGGNRANNGTYQVRLHLVQQKCQAVRVMLEDVVPSGSCESFSLSSVAYEVGIKKGAAKLPAAQGI